MLILQISCESDGLHILKLPTSTGNIKKMKENIEYIEYNIENIKKCIAMFQN